jgi:hypothetical protein
MRKLFISLLFLCLASGVAEAQAASYSWSVVIYAQDGTFTEPTPALACTLATTSSTAVAQGFSPGTAVFYSVSTYLCNGSRTGGSYSYAISRGGSVCATGSTYNSATGLCDTSTPPPPSCTAGTAVTFREDFGVPSKTAGSGVPVGYVPQHYNGCAVTVTGVTACHTTTATGHVTCDYVGVETGVAAPADGADETAVPTSSTGTTPVATPVVGDAGSIGCPSGSVQGGVDSAGITICIGKPGAPTQPNTVTSAPSTVTNADGSTTTTQKVTTVNSDGSITTTNNVTTTGKDGTVTTSQTAATGSSSTGAPGVEDPPPDDFCAQHPQLTVCQNSTVAGSCAQTTCMGDAIQCSILRQAADADCRANQNVADLKASKEYALGLAVGNGSDPLASSIPSAANAASVVMPSSLDATGWLGGGACFADKTISIPGGQQLVIPFSEACQYLVVFRYGLMVVSMLVSFKILSGAILRE